MPDSNDVDEKSQPPIVVPHTGLSPDALTGVIESFVLREGTDYGERDVPFETKVLQVRQQLERREAEIVYDPDTATIDIVVRRVSSQQRSRS